jgi:AcrR family transcriptional regulator
MSKNEPTEALSRDDKRRHTRSRITDSAIKLFLKHGYEATTLDAIAEAAKISRRTFFSYFKSKDELLAAFNDQAWEQIVAELLLASPDREPLDVVRDVLVKHASRYTTDQMQAIDRLMRSSEALLASKPALYARQERALFAAMSEVWRQPERQERLRTIAMVSIGATRLAIDAWHRDSGKRSPGVFLKEAFERLKHVAS